MTDPKSNLMAKYLAGDADADEVEQLNRAIADNPDAADELLAQAFMDVHLRETLSGKALGEAITSESLQPNPVTARIAPRRWMVAALLLAAITGWTVAAYVAKQLGNANTNINTLTTRVTELEKASSNQPALVTKDAAPEIHSTRGWLMALPDNGGFEGETLMVGTTAPMDQRLWTCPWGAAEFRYGNGISISIERNTTVKLSETDNLRRLMLERGIVHVTNLTQIDRRPTEIKTTLATVRLIQGQVAVQVDEQRTAVEVAVNDAEVIVNEDGIDRTFTVQRGHYLIIKPGEKAKVLEGMLKLGLEPPSK